MDLDVYEFARDLFERHRAQLQLQRTAAPQFAPKTPLSVGG